MKLDTATAVDFSPDDSKIVSCDTYNNDGKIKIWRTNDGKKIK